MSTVMKTTTPASTDPLMIDGISYQSRLLVGTGKYRDMEETRRLLQRGRCGTHLSPGA